MVLNERKWTNGTSKSWPLIDLDATATLGRCARSNPSFHSELETESSCCRLYEVHNSLRWQARCVFRLHPRFVLPYFDFKLENTLFCILLLLVSSFTRLLDSRHCLSGALGSGVSRHFARWQERPPFTQSLTHLV